MSRPQEDVMPSGRFSVARLLEERGVSRREFLAFCSAVTAAMALPATMVPKVAHALDKVQRPPLVWMEFQDCCGDTEALLRSANPTVGELVLDILSIDYHETIMAAAGHQAEATLEKTITDYKGKYLCIVEGSIPMKDGGVYGCVGGNPTSTGRGRSAAVRLPPLRWVPVPHLAALPLRFPTPRAQWESPGRCREPRSSTCRAAHAMPII